MSNVRIRSAVLAFFLGNLGVDMLLLRPHQAKLFLTLGGACIAAAVLALILALTQGAGGWVFVYVVAIGFLEFWSLARFFEYLNLSDEQFAELLAKSNADTGVVLQPA